MTLREFELALCKHLGVDANRVTRITLDMIAGQLPAVHVFMFVNPADEMQELRTFILNTTPLAQTGSSVVE